MGMGYDERTGPLLARVRELENQVAKWRELARKAWLELEMIDPNCDVTEELFCALSISDADECTGPLPEDEED